MKHLSVFSALAAILAFFAPAEACTGLRLTAKDGNAVHGRTFEFGVKVDTSVVVVPRGYSFTASTPNGKGLTYQSKYAVVGTIASDTLNVLDGLNEMGLSIGTFYFPGYAGYTPTTAENQSKSLSPVDFPNWVVTQFSTLDEVKNNLSNVVIAPTVVKEWGSTPAPFHYIVYDKSGKSIVIEPMNNKLVVHENPLGVLTNSPTFDWHMTSLRNYINLSPKNDPPLKIGNLTLAPFGQGSGMVGLPGDFTPPSRFVRAAIYSVTAIPSANADEGVFQAFHILNQFDIPVGIARQVEKGVVYSDYTLATVVHDPSHLKYYFRTYDDQTIKVVDLNAFDKQGSQVKRASTSGRQPYVDISKDLKAS